MWHSLLGSKWIYYLQIKENTPMGKTTFTITPGAVIELIGNEAVVMLPGSTSVMRVSEEQAHTLRAIEAGHTPGLPAQTVESLIDAGIVVSEAGMSRRSLVKAGAIGAGAGIAVMAMPGVAAASSGPAETAPAPDGAPAPSPSGDLVGTLTITGSFARFQVFKNSNLANFPVFSSGDVAPPIDIEGYGAVSLFIVILNDRIIWDDSNYTGPTGASNPIGTFTWQDIPYRVTFSSS
jgi:hypothetical protein